MGFIDKQLYENESSKRKRILKQQSYAEATCSKDKQLSQAQQFLIQVTIQQLVLKLVMIMFHKSGS